jgi:hypothetical protein
MDCIDCHNRPTHIFDLTPALALDRGFHGKLLDRDMPFLKAVALPLLKKEDRPREDAVESFRKDLAAAYKSEHPDLKIEAKALDRAAAGLAKLYKDNIVPARGVAWGTYADHIGHQGEKADIRGCFRCHDDKHSTKDGETLSQDCGLCHDLIAEEQPPGDLDDYLQLLLFGEG